MFMIYVPCANRQEAEKIAGNLVEGKLAVCVNILDKVTSVYRWQGKVEKQAEAVMIVKTVRKKLVQAVAAIKKQHSYEFPDIIYWEGKSSREIDEWMNLELT
ncbi:hypothetical protein A3J20_02875 [Candidatus Gottesmanbacteria bacterium RIFCSPLOWO2_02_FULL_42_29]|uniref:Divalent-cation tolerance protein CutA n=1 Tax=Candidatus Gottesmanbacteria bacterium RIFCSPLOWO2_01_FULL_42_22 TaxID=1798391 RepID=A0A1F6B9B3_9BACT|nr:MAG: hypothetical protein A2781_06845 [Candidatus Gottesmanbacteria bacterium RIFCSPHIGHO2_01_FULL_42_27]OGG19552.1 MAG: hypothetical protein A3E72_06755 [Candidatus Gottesmanbacteria bacterium RIFCSPHIGHO2_12_FULL_43_26]OGG33505.1 MAG: hypothetical protein A2968_00975 [Candidatus Gottesmanbacteria bacterium RIFCSPLOWO2_01_FULL_42_22]OGG34567.1 MAG: hypothetical protein A3G68_00415 [Candidatus Gottesmanbacteria bacterium RIFCSPLOWO2_12_FULL_42_10]OGG36859.1 MAG: hypothetical protein A3J20_02